MLVLLTLYLHQVSMLLGLYINWCNKNLAIISSESVSYNSIKFLLKPRKVYFTSGNFIVCEEARNCEKVHFSRDNNSQKLFWGIGKNESYSYVCVLDGKNQCFLLAKTLSGIEKSELWKT